MILYDRRWYRKGVNMKNYSPIILIFTEKDVILCTTDREKEFTNPQCIGEDVVNDVLWYMFRGELYANR